MISFLILSLPGKKKDSQILSSRKLHPLALFIFLIKRDNAKALPSVSHWDF